MLPGNSHLLMPLKSKLETDLEELHNKKDKNDLEKKVEGILEGRAKEEKIIKDAKNFYGFGSPVYTEKYKRKIKEEDKILKEYESKKRPKYHPNYDR